VPKIILISILALTIIVPAVSARRLRSPHLALRRTVFWMLVGICVYAMVVVFIYPRFLG
jgi:hypothetical protein